MTFRPPLAAQRIARGLSLVGLLLGGPAAWAVQDLDELSLEGLGRVSVSSVSKRPEPLSQAPAAVTVLTAEDLASRGVTSLPEALRLVPGLHVARFDNSTWAISARGFNSLLADKMEVLLDGRTLYSPLFSGVFWDQQGVNFEDIARIEVIRGPGGALWGANAVNGVINIITRSAADTLDSVARVEVGTAQTYRAELREGLPLANGGLRLYARAQRWKGLLDESGDPAEEPWRQAALGARLDTGPWRVQMEGFEGVKPTVFGELLTQGAFASVQHLAGGPRGDRHRLQAFVDFQRRDVSGNFAEDRLTIDAEAQTLAYAGPRVQLLLGAGVRHSRDDTRSVPAFGFDPADTALTYYNGFVQGQWQPAPAWRLNLGSRFEHNPFTGFEYLPAVSLAWLPSPATSAWASVARAVRTPSRLDRDIDFALPAGATSVESAGAGFFGGGDVALAPSPPFSVEQCVMSGFSEAFCEGALSELFLTGDPPTEEECADAGVPFPLCELLFPADTSPVRLRGTDATMSERLIAYQAGLRQQLGASVDLDVAVFMNDYSRLRSIQFNDEGDLDIVSQGVARSRGAELALGWPLQSHHRLRAGVAWLDIEQEVPALDDPSQRVRLPMVDPQWQGFVRVDGGHGSVAWGAALRHVGPLKGLDVAEVTQLDLNLRWRALPRLELRMAGYNLLHNQRVEFAAFGLRRAVERSVQMGLRWDW